jgi:hypothetical protein
LAGAEATKYAAALVFGEEVVGVSSGHGSDGERWHARGEYVALAVEKVIEHILIEAGFDPTIAHDAGEAVGRVAGMVVERTGQGADLSRGQLAGMAQRVARDVAHELGPQLNDAASVRRAIALAEPQLASTFERGLKREIDRSTPRQQLAAPHKLSGRELAQGMQKTGRPGRIIPNAGRQQSREARRDRGR